MDRYRKFRGVKKLKKGRYRVRARALDPRTGKQRQIRKTVEAKSIEDAAKKRDELVEEIRQGVTKNEERMRLADYASDWLERRSPMLRRSTLDQYTSVLAHIEAALGDYYLDAILPSDVEKWQAKALASGRAPVTINGWVRVLRTIYKDARRDHGVADPTEGVRALTERKTSGRRGTALSLDEFRRYLTAVQALSGTQRRGAIQPDVARMLLTLPWTGLRRGELLALRWDDYVDGELRVERSVFRHAEAATKTGDPRRIAVVEPLSKVLDDQRRWLLAKQHPGLSSGLMFPARPAWAEAGARRRGVEVDWYRTGSCMDRQLAKVVRTGNLPEISVHSLRRTFENLLRRAGVDQLVRRTMAGWRTEEAQAIYASVDSSERAAAGKEFVKLVLCEGRAEATSEATLEKNIKVPGESGSSNRA